ncbi:MAG TPA: lipase family protein [Steroidobacteraceae bacterium]
MMIRCRGVGHRRTWRAYFALNATLACLYGCSTWGWPPLPVAVADRMEKANALPLSSFYDTPADISASRPGDLLRKADASDYSLPKGTRAVRILYHSLDADGKDVATSAAILIPAGSPTMGGWRVIAWAHGTSGVARQCAPSAMKDLYYGDEGLFEMVKAGYVVIATDYHGLGTEGPHQYMSKRAQAHDVIFSVPAARAAIAGLGANWVVDGHSQGGVAAWGVAEMEADLQDPSYLGAVAVSAATNLADALQHSEDIKGAGFYLVWLAYGAHAQFPEFQPSDALSAIGFAHYDSATTGGCWLHGYATYKSVETSAMFRPISSKINGSRSISTRIVPARPQSVLRYW